MSGDPFAWDVWIDDDGVPWFYVTVPSPAEGAIWLPAMYAAFEAVAQRFELPGGDTLSRLVHAAGAAMAGLPRGASAYEALVRSVGATVEELDRILSHVG